MDNVPKTSRDAVNSQYCIQNSASDYEGILKSALKVLAEQQLDTKFEKSKEVMIPYEYPTTSVLDYGPPICNERLKVLYDEIQLMQDKIFEQATLPSWMLLKKIPQNKDEKPLLEKQNVIIDREISFNGNNYLKIGDQMKDNRLLKNIEEFNELNSIFLNLWTTATHQEGYDKEKWKNLQSLIQNWAIKMRDNNLFKSGDYSLTITTGLRPGEVIEDQSCNGFDLEVKQTESYPKSIGPLLSQKRVQVHELTSMPFACTEKDNDTQIGCITSIENNCGNRTGVYCYCFHGIKIMCTISEIPERDNHLFIRDWFNESMFNESIFPWPPAWPQHSWKNLYMRKNLYMNFDSKWFNMKGCFVSEIKDKTFTIICDSIEECKEETKFVDSSFVKVLSPNEALRECEKETMKTKINDGEIIVTDDNREVIVSVVGLKANEEKILIDKPCFLRSTHGRDGREGTMSKTMRKVEPRNVAYWEVVRQGAERVAHWPDWRRRGIGAPEPAGYRDVQDVSTVSVGESKGREPTSVQILSSDDAKWQTQVKEEAKNSTNQQYDKCKQLLDLEIKQFDELQRHGHIKKILKETQINNDETIVTDSDKEVNIQVPPAATIKSFPTYILSEEKNGYEYIGEANKVIFKRHNAEFDIRIYNSEVPLSVLSGDMTFTTLMKVNNKWITIYYCCLESSEQNVFHIQGSRYEAMKGNEKPHILGQDVLKVTEEFPAITKCMKEILKDTINHAGDPSMSEQVFPIIPEEQIKIEKSGETRGMRDMTRNKNMNSVLLVDKYGICIKCEEYIISTINVANINFVVDTKSSGTVSFVASASNDKKIWTPLDNDRLNTNFSVERGTGAHKYKRDSCLGVEEAFGTNIFGRIRYSNLVNRYIKIRVIKDQNDIDDNNNSDRLKISYSANVASPALMEKYKNKKLNESYYTAVSEKSVTATANQQFPAATLNRLKVKWIAELAPCEQDIEKQKDWTQSWYDRYDDE